MEKLGPLPITLGVTGHRDLRSEDIPTLEARVGEVLDELKSAYAHSPLQLITPLAEGADRLVARACLKRGMTLIAPLPLPRALYEADFSTPESRSEFADLLGRASESLELPILAGADATEIATYGEARDRQYAAVGAYVIRHSQILIALWDGMETQLTGGTWDTLRRQLRGADDGDNDSFDPLDPPERGPVFHVVTPRQRHTELPARALELRVLLPGSDLARWAPLGEFARSASARLFRRMDLFNRDAVQFPHREDLSHLPFDTAAVPLVLERDVPPHMRQALDAFGHADSLAIRFKRRTTIGLRILFALAFLSVLFLSLYSDVERNPFLVTAYFLGLAAAYTWFVWVGTMPEPPDWLRNTLGHNATMRLWGQRGDYKSRHLDYRALAEGLRVQVVWALSGVGDLVAERYLRKQRTELDWIRYALRAWMRQSATPAARPEETLSPGVASVVPEAWMEQQSDYYRFATNRDRSALARKERIVSILFLAGLLLAASLLLHVLSGGQGRVIDYTLFGSGIALAAAALVEGYADKVGIAQQVRQFERMELLFARAAAEARRFRLLGREDAIKRLVRDLGEEALSEHGDWVLLHRERGLEVPG